MISCSAFSFTGSILVFGGGGGGGGPSDPPSCGRKVKGTPKIFTYSGSNNPSSPTHMKSAADHGQQLARKEAGYNARSPMICAIVWHPNSESMPTEMTFCTCSPGWPILPTVSTPTVIFPPAVFVSAFFFALSPHHHFLSSTSSIG